MAAEDAAPFDSAFWESRIMAAALASRDLGRVLRAYRTHPAWAIPMGQRRVGMILGISQGQVSRIERGEHTHHPLDRLIGFANALGIPHRYRWFDGNPTPARHTAYADRTAALFAAAEHTSPLAVAPHGRRRLRDLRQLLQRSPSRCPWEVTRAIDETRLLMGILHAETGRPRLSHLYLSMAAERARQRRDRPLLAYIVAAQAHRLPADAALPRLQQAERQLVGAINSAITRSLLACRIADQAALLGHAETAVRAIERARLLVEYTDHDDDRPWTLSYDRRTVDATTAVVYSRIRHPDRVPTLQTAIGNFGAPRSVSDARLAIDLAVAAATDGLHHPAHRLIAAANQIARRTTVPSLRRQLRLLDRRLLAAPPVAVNRSGDHVPPLSAE